MNISFKHISKTFGNAGRTVTAVDGIDLEINDGEFFVLLGPSGCGKSTLLNLTAGLEKPSGGEIWFGDQRVAVPGESGFRTPRERNVAMVFQSYALYPHLTAFENIAFPLRIAGEKGKRVLSAVQEVAARLGLSDLLGAKPSELSGGQRQRVAIARAIVRKPGVFLLDEPLSNLDAQLRTAMRRELKDLQRSLKITTLYVTHDQVEAMTLGDRIALLQEGKIEQIGTPKDLYDRPSTPFVATFIGSPPMNLLEGDVREEKGVRYLVISKQKIKLPESAAGLKLGCGLFGIRPEDLRIYPVEGDLPPGQGYLRGRVVWIEPLGRETVVHLSINGQTLSVLGTTAAAALNQSAGAGFDPLKIHAFR